MTEPLRPMSTGQLLDRTFSLYRKNFTLFVGIATVGPAAYLIFELLTVGSAMTPASRSARIATAGVSYVISICVGLVVMLAGMALAHAATVKAVAAVYLGRETTIAGAYRELRGRVMRVLGVFFLVMLLIFVGAGVIAVVAGILASLAIVGGARSGTGGAIAGGIVGVVAVIGGALLAITIYVRYSMAVQACVVEDIGVRASLKRSVVLSKGSRSRVLAIYFIFAVLSMVFGGILGALAGATGALIGNRFAALGIIYLANFVAGALTGPLATIGMSLLYYDERVRKEAFDIQLMMASLDATAPPPLQAPAAPAQI